MTFKAAYVPALSLSSCAFFLPHLSLLHCGSRRSPNKPTRPRHYLCSCCFLSFGPFIPSPVIKFPFIVKNDPSCYLFWKVSPSLSRHKLFLLTTPLHTGLLLLTYNLFHLASGSHEHPSVSHLIQFFEGRGQWPILHLSPLQNFPGLGKSSYRVNVC